MSEKYLSIDTRPAKFFCFMYCKTQTSMARRSSSRYRVAGALHILVVVVVRLVDDADPPNESCPSATSYDRMRTFRATVKISSTMFSRESRPCAPWTGLPCKSMKTAASPWEACTITVSPPFANICRRNKSSTESVAH